MKRKTHKSRNLSNSSAPADLSDPPEDEAESLFGAEPTCESKPKRAIDPNEPAVARGRALRLLGRREHSARELQGKLRQRGVSGERAREVVDALAVEGWQSDARFVEVRVRSRIDQGYGPLRIAAELAEAGVSENLRREALQHATQSLAEQDLDWALQAGIAWARHFRAPPADAAQWQKHYRYLAARGFEAAHIRAALKAAGSQEAPEFDQ